ncbi:MAG: AMP-binding protein, partial [Pseudorhodoplanes sp.]
MLSQNQDYEKLYREFRWKIPERYNIGVDVCDRWAEREPGRAALIHVHANGRADRITFGALKAQSNRLANALRAHGVRRGDRVAILLPQTPEALIAHIAIYKLAAIVLPLAPLFGTEALAYRLQNSGAKALITNVQGVAKLSGLDEAASGLSLILSIDGAGDRALDFEALLAEASDDFSPQDTSADDPAMMIYTSGTTGPPKGALHAHRVLLGHLPGFEMPHDF